MLDQLKKAFTRLKGLLLHPSSPNIILIGCSVAWIVLVACVILGDLA